MPNTCRGRGEMSFKGNIVYTWLLVLLLTLQVKSQTLQQAQSATGIQTGLLVRLGPTDGGIETEAANSNRFLVHMLSNDQNAVHSAREKWAQQGLYGLAAAEWSATLQTLPYATSLVNLLVADLDALGAKAPAENEILRVLVPEGAAYLKKGGSWSVVKKSRPAGMDSWSHYSHSAHGNPVSNETTVQRPTGIKWISWYMKFDYNVRALTGIAGQELVTSDNTVFMSNPWREFNGDKTNNKQYYTSRDAFNGISRWVHKRPTRNWVTHIVASEKLLIGADGTDTPLKGWDAMTGEEKVVYKEAGITSGSYSVQAAEHQGRLFVTNVGKVCRFETNTGKNLWCKTENGIPVYPTVSEDGKVLYHAMYAYEKDEKGRYPKKTFGVGRFPSTKVKELVARDIATGDIKWRTSSFVGKGGGPVKFPNVSSIVSANNQVAMFGAMMYTDPYLGIFNAADGKFVWHHNMQKVRKNDVRGLGEQSGGYWNVTRESHGQGFWVLRAFYRDNVWWAAANASMIGFDPSSGEVIKSIGPGTVNNRCVGGSATRNKFILGFGLVLDQDMASHTFHNISRGGCGSFIVPANGMLYTQPNGGCGCFVRIRNATAISTDPLRPDAPMETRIQTNTSLGGISKQSLPAQGLSLVSYQPAKPGPKAEALTNFGMVGNWPKLEGNPIVNDWTNNDLVGVAETQPLSANGGQYVAMVHQHRMEFRKGGNVAWAYTAGGRITSPPVITDGMCIFGSHDGYVYALDAGTGAFKWRFLGARDDRRIMAHSQLESAQPVFGVTLYQGKIAFSAGRHPELDGGIFTWGLEPKTGAVVWNSVIKTDRVVSTDQRAFRNYRNNVLGTRLMSGGGALNFQSTKPVRGTISIDPDNPGEYVTSTVPGPRVRVRNTKLTLEVMPGGTGLGLQLPESIRQAKVTVWDIEGRKVLLQNVSDGVGVIPAINLNQGQYLVRVEADKWSTGFRFSTHGNNLRVFTSRKN